MTSADDRQPGSSGAKFGHEFKDDGFGFCDVRVLIQTGSAEWQKHPRKCSIHRNQHGGSGAGSTEFHPDELCFVCRRNSVNHALQAHTFITDEHKRTMEELQQTRVALEAAQGEIERLKAAVASYETGITWQTTCLKHAHNLDWAYARHLELENERDQSRATEAELRAKLEGPDSPTWEHVMDFAEEMERKLSLHRDRGNREGWLIETPRWLFERMLREVVELGDALGYPVTIRVGRATPDGEEPGQECADVANLAMMVRDRMRSAALDATEQPARAEGEANG